MHGRITDRERAALFGVSIGYTDALGNARTSATNETGSYSIAANPGSPVRFVGVGLKTLTVPAEADGVRRDLVLDESTTALDPVEVRPTPKPRSSGGLLLGLLIALGVVLGAYVAPVFYGLSAIVGAGLIFAGVSGVARNG